MVGCGCVSPRLAIHGASNTYTTPRVFLLSNIMGTFRSCFRFIFLSSSSLSRFFFYCSVFYFLTFHARARPSDMSPEKFSFLIFEIFLSHILGIRIFTIDWKQFLHFWFRVKNLKEKPKLNDWISMNFYFEIKQPISPCIFIDVTPK